MANMVWHQMVMELCANERKHGEGFSPWSGHGRLAQVVSQSTSRIHHRLKPPVQQKQQPLPRHPRALGRDSVQLA